MKNKFKFLIMLLFIFKQQSVFAKYKCVVLNFQYQNCCPKVGHAYSKEFEVYNDNHELFEDCGGDKQVKCLDLFSKEESTFASDAAFKEYKRVKLLINQWLGRMSSKKNQLCDLNPFPIVPSISTINIVCSKEHSKLEGFECSLKGKGVKK